MERRDGPEAARRRLLEGPAHAFIFPNLFLGETNIAIVEPIDVAESVHWHTPMFLKGVPQFNGRLLRMAEAGMGPASFLMPEDLTVASRNQLGLEARGLAALSLGDDRLAVIADGLRRRLPGRRRVPLPRGAFRRRGPLRGVARTVDGGWRLLGPRHHRPRRESRSAHLPHLRQPRAPRYAREAAPDGAPLQPGARLADATAHLQHRGDAQRGWRARRGVELHPRRAVHPGEARDALVGGTHDPSPASRRGSAPDEP